MIASSSSHPRLKEAAHLLRSSHERRQSGYTVLEGEHLIELYSESFGAPLTLIVSEKFITHPLASRFSRDLFIAENRWFEKNAPIAQGMLAVIRVPKGKNSIGRFCVLLEDVQDPGNAGGILRTAAAAGCTDVIFSANSAAAWSPKTLRAAQGAHFLVNVAIDVDALSFARDFQAHGGVLIASAPRGGESLFEISFPEESPMALIVGNEGAGISETLMARVDRRVTIPMPGGMESLNVGSATAILLFECARQRLTKISK